MIISSITKPKRSESFKKQISKASQGLYQMLEATCHICAHPYNSKDQLPITICHQQHTYCSKCVTDLFSHHPSGTRCPTCRVYICQKGTHVNKSLLRICDLLPNLATKLANIELQKQQLQQRLMKMKNDRQKRQFLGNILQQRIDPMKNVKQLSQYSNNLPSIGNQPASKPKKLNIHNYLARKRLISSKQGQRSDKKENCPIGLKKNLN